MRENKFRVWDKTHKFFHYDGYYLSANGKDLFSAIKGDLLDDDWEKYFDIQWYASLKDKNSIEIYEGDIVDVCGYGIKSEISWAYCSWQMKNGGMLDSFRKYDLEVIGNIHENPKLLENHEPNPTLKQTLHE